MKQLIDLRGRRALVTGGGRGIGWSSSTGGRTSGLTSARADAFNNTTSPYVKLKLADKEFDKVKLDEMPDMKE